MTLIPQEDAEITNKVKDIFSMSLDFVEEPALFLSDILGKEEPNKAFLLDDKDSSLNHERIGIIRSDNYGIETVLTESKFNTALENCNARMYRVNPDNSETTLQVGVI
ncbi:hypothetical protein D3C71_1936510 [compost metagenome]